MFEGTNDVYRALLGPRLGFLLGGSAKGVQRIDSGSSTHLKKLVILAAIALEHSSPIFSHVRASFWAYFLIMRHLLQFFGQVFSNLASSGKIIIIFMTQI